MPGAGICPASRVRAQMRRSWPAQLGPVRAVDWSPGYGADWGRHGCRASRGPGWVLGWLGVPSDPQRISGWPFPSDPLRPSGQDRDLAVLLEHDRIATQLQNEVIHRIFAIGLTLQSAAAKVAGPLMRQVEKAIDDIDGVVKIIRDNVFGLQDRLKDHGFRGRDRLRDVTTPQGRRDT